jgi:predicted small lipoprotein YifL
VALRTVDEIACRAVNPMNVSGVSFVSSRELLTTVAVSALLFGALAGCGSTPDSAPDSAPSGSDQKQEQSPLAELVADVPGSLQKAASSDKVTSVKFTMTGMTEETKVSGTGDMAFEPLKMEMTIENAGEGSTAIRILDGAFYMKVPAEDRADMDGKTWMKVRPGEDSPFTASSGPWRDMNPVEQVKTLLAGGTAKAVGNETIDGVQTAHYSGTVPVAKAIEQVDAEYRSTAKKTYDDAGVKTITTDMWIDAEYRPHRAHVVAGSMSDLTVEYSGYNEPVTVSTPAASETFDFAKMLKGIGG